MGRSSLKSTSRAGSKGAGADDDGGSGQPASGSGEEKGESDQQADNAITGSTKLSNGRNRGLSGNPTMTKSANREGAKNDEGSVSVAAAFVLNVMDNEAIAYIDDAAKIIAKGEDPDEPGKLSILVYGDTDADIFANASATESSTGVGVAVAVNVVEYHNKAYLGKVAVEADELEIIVDMYEDEKPERKTAYDKAQEKGGEPKNILEVLITDAMTKAFDEALEKIDAENHYGKAIAEALCELTTDIIATFVATFAEAVTSELGLNGFLSTDIETKLEDFRNNAGQKFSDAAMGVLKDVFLAYVMEKFKGLAGTLTTDMQNKITNTTSVSATSVQNSPTQNGQNVPLAELVQSKINNVKDTQKGKQAAAELKTLSINALEKFLNDSFEGFVDVTKLKQYILNCSKNGILPSIRDTLLNALQQCGAEVTEVALDALSGWLDAPVVPEDETPMHKFSTQAVSGAGATNVGIAGSAAVAVINGDSIAFIEGLGDNDNPDDFEQYFNSNSHEQCMIFFTHEWLLESKFRLNFFAMLKHKCIANKIWNNLESVCIFMNMFEHEYLTDLNGKYFGK